MRDSSHQDNADHSNGHGASEGNNPQRQPPARNSSRHSSRPPSRVPSSNMLVAVPAAPPVQMGLQDPNHRTPASVGTGVSHAWLATPSSDGHPHTHSDYSQQHGWTGSGQVSPHAGDTPESVFVDAHAESLSSLDGTQNSGSLYTANSVLSVKGGVSIDVVGGARPASGPLSAGSSAGPGGPPPQASGSSSRMLPLHTVHSLNDNGMREYASERIEHAATAMEIVSGALRQPGNAWAQGAPSILDFGPGGRPTIPGRAVSQGEGVALANTAAPVGVHLHSGMVHATHATHEGFPAREVHGEAVQLARYPYVGQATDVMGCFGRGSDVGSSGPGGSGFGGNGGGQRSGPYHRNEGGQNMRRSGDHGGPQGGGGYGGGGGGYGSGRGKQKYVGGRGNKMRSNSAGPYSGGGGRGGGGRDGGGGPHQHQHRYPPAYNKSNHHSGHNTYMNNGGMGQQHHGSMHSSRHSATSGHIGSDGRMDSQERTRSEADVDPRLKLDNAAQFPALEGGAASPRAAAAVAAAAHWPAKDRSTGPYSGASPPATQGSYSGPSASAMSSSEDPAAIVAAAAIEAAVNNAAGAAAAGPAAVSATGASGSDHSQAQSGSLPASTSTQDTMLHPPTRAWSETGGGTGAWIGGCSGGRGSRQGAGSASNVTTPRAGPSSWSEVASSPATGTAAGRHNRNPSLGNTTGFPMEPIAPRAWHAGSGRVGGGYGGRSGGGRRPVGGGMHHSGGPHHSMPHRRGRSVDDDRNSNLEGMHSGSSARSDGKAAQPPRPVGVVNIREQ